MNETIEIMGIRVKKSQASQDCKQQKHCTYLDNGFCQVCTCDECEGGLLISEWKESIRQGCLTCGPRECRCVELARNKKRLRDSGLENLAERCTFDSFSTLNTWQATMKGKAIEYLSERGTVSFFVSGQSGCGKTHLCTAICNEIIRRGGRLKYYQWVKDGTRTKQVINDRDLYEKEINALIEMPFLYMDDLFKQEVSSADIRLAYEIINGRYNAGRPTILSSERNLPFIRKLRNGDGEAIAGRIFETCCRGKYCIELSGADKNLRFSQMQQRNSYPSVAGM